MQPTTRTRECVHRYRAAIGIAVAVLLTIGPAKATQLTEVETFDGIFLFHYNVPGQKEGTGAAFVTGVTITSLDFTPGAVTFEGQPVDFDGTEASFLATTYQGGTSVQSGPVPTPGPVPADSFGTIFGMGAFNSDGPKKQQNLELGPGFSENDYQLVPGSLYEETWQFNDWQSGIVPELNGAVVRWEMLVQPISVDPTGIVEADVTGKILAVSPPAVDNFQFSQIDWLDENRLLQIPDSSWGVIEFDYFPHPFQTFYLNVDVDNGGPPVPAVRNYPLFPQTVGGISGLKREAVDFDITLLGLSSGTDLPLVNFTFVIDFLPNPAPTFPPPLTATVLDLERYAWGARIPGTGLPAVIGKPSGVQNNNQAKNVIQHRNVPSVQEGDKQCLPGSMARSIAWLLKKNNLGNQTGQSIFNDLAAFDNPTRLSYEAFVAKKATYLKDKSHQRGVTKILDLNNAIGPVAGVKEETGTDLVTWLRRELPTEDVELHYDTHIVTLTGFYQTGSGAGLKNWVKFRDDEEQGDDTKGDAAEKKAELRKNADGTYSFREEGTTGFHKVRAAVSESIPSRITLDKDPSSGNTTFDWEPLGFRDQFDLFSGDLLALRASGGDFAVSPSICLRNDIPAPPDPYDFGPIPVSPGDVQFFLHRPVVVGQPGTYNSLGFGQSGDRDGVSLSTGGCPACAHDVCIEGEPLLPGCDDRDLDPLTPDCVESICLVDSVCCTSVWDVLCVEAVGPVCSTPCLPR